LDNAPGIRKAGVADAAESDWDSEPEEAYATTKIDGEPVTSSRAGLSLGFSDLLISTTGSSKQLMHQLDNKKWDIEEDLPGDFVVANDPFIE